MRQNMEEMQALDAWWALHTALPEVDSAEMLFVNPHFISGTYIEYLENDRRSGVTTGASVAEREIIDVFNRLRWCVDRGTPIVIYENIIGRSSPDYACHGKGKPPA